MQAVVSTGAIFVGSLGSSGAKVIATSVPSSPKGMSSPGLPLFGVPWYMQSISWL